MKHWADPFCPDPIIQGGRGRGKSGAGGRRYGPPPTHKASEDRWLRIWERSRRGGICHDQVADVILLPLKNMKNWPDPFLCGSVADVFLGASFRFRSGLTRFVLSFPSGSRINVNHHKQRPSLF